MSRVAAPPTVDLAKVGKGNAWHVVAEDESDGDLKVVKTYCGLDGPATGFEGGVDARVVQHRGEKVCANCRTQHALKTTHDNAGDEPEKEDDMSATATPEKQRAPRREAKPKGATVKAATKAEIEKAIAKAEKAIATQPSRTTADLTPKQAEKAFKLGKAIAADRWLLKKAEAGKTSSATLAAMVERIEARVAERNKIREGK